MQGIVIIMFLTVWRWIYAKVLFRIWTGIGTRLSSSRPMPCICSCIASVKRGNWSQRDSTELVWSYLTFLAFSPMTHPHSFCPPDHFTPPPSHGLELFLLLCFLSHDLHYLWAVTKWLGFVWCIISYVYYYVAGPPSLLWWGCEWFLEQFYPYRPYYLSYFNLFWGVDSHGTLMWIISVLHKRAFTSWERHKFLVDVPLSFSS